jgi:hypothetical protein
MISVPPDLLSDALLERSARHAARYGAVLKEFRLRIEARYQTEVRRMKGAFESGTVGRGADAFIQHLTDYVGWLGWSSWCSSHLAPPLELVTDADVNRVAASMLVYAGPRIIDDALDDHRSYKGKRGTLVGGLTFTHAHIDEATRRAYATLAGTWVMLFGIERLRRHGGEAAANTTLRLCERIAPGALLEGLQTGATTLAEYERIIQIKAVWYDEILYRNLLEPCPQPLRSTVIRATAHLSRLAQYLNDVSDYDADKHAERSNVCNWLQTPDAIHAHCASEVFAIGEIIDELPDEVGDALAASLSDTCRAAQRINDTQRQSLGDQA